MTKKSLRILVIVLFTVYCAALVFVLFMPNSHRYGMARRSCNLIPFATVWGLLKSLGRINTDIIIRNIGVNLILFLPMGMALPVLFKKLRRFGRTLLVCLGIIILAETIQYIFMLGACDIDDVILNTAGAAAGYGLVHLPPAEKFLEI